MSEIINITNANNQYHNANLKLYLSSFSPNLENIMYIISQNFQFQILEFFLGSNLICASGSSTVVVNLSLTDSSKKIEEKEFGYTFSLLIKTRKHLLYPYERLYEFVKLAIVPCQLNNIA